MKMPRSGTRFSRKKNGYSTCAVIFLLVLAVSVTFVAAENTIMPTCSEVDQFGNPICTDLQPADQPVVTAQENTTGNAWYSTGVASITGRVKDMYQGVQGSIAELMKVAGLGIRGSINQTRLAGEHTGPGDTKNGAGQESDPLDEEPPYGIQGQVMQLGEIAVRGLKNSINQTLHADEYPRHTGQGSRVSLDNASEEGVEATPPNILRATYAGITRMVLQFIDIAPRAFKGSLRNNSDENKSVWTNLSADNQGSSPLDAPVLDEWFQPIPEVPVTRVVRNATPDPSLLLAHNSTPREVLPVPPTPTPVPVPRFNLSVDSEPRGALIVLNGDRAGTTPYVITGLEQKTYTLNLTRSGHLAYGEVVTLDRDIALEIPLTPSMDALFVTPGKSTAQNRYGGLYVTSYPDGLDLTIDGVEVTGGTPYLYYGFTEGLHTIRVSRNDKDSGSVTYSRSAWVYHDAVSTFAIDTEESLLPKRISINPGPYSGAEFTINGKFPSGRLPATISAGCPGSFISVRKNDDFSSFLIPCTNQDTVTMNLANSTDPHPPLLVSSAPAGAEIFIDGFRTGYTTPYTFTGVSGGLHRVMVSKPGLYPKEEVVAVEIRDADTSPQKVFFLMENYGEGTIVVDSLPRGATIYINGWPPGESTPHTFDHMKIGFYEVIVQMGSKPWIEQFDLTPSKVSKVVADFEI